MNTRWPKKKKAKINRCVLLNVKHTNCNLEQWQCNRGQSGDNEKNTEWSWAGRGSSHGKRVVGRDEDNVIIKQGLQVKKYNYSW